MNAMPQNSKLTPLKTSLVRLVVIFAVSLGLTACVYGEDTELVEAPEDDTNVVRSSYTDSAEQTNFGPCVTYLGTVGYDYETCNPWCERIDYYDQFYNQCNGTYTETYLRTKVVRCYYGICP